MDYEKCGKFLSSLRKGKNMTQQQLADLLNYSFKTISKWERGESFPTDISTLEKIAKIFDVTIDEIRNGERINELQKKEQYILSKTKKIYSKHKNSILLSLFLLLLIIIVLLVCTYYFFIRNNIRIYSLSITNEEYSTENSLLILYDNNKSMFLFNKIKSESNKNIDAIKIYYVKDEKEHLIVATGNENINITENASYEEYNLKCLEENPLFIDITADNETETYLINLTLILKNDKIKNEKVEKITNNPESQKISQNFDDFLKNNGFNEEGTDYIKTIDNLMISYDRNSMLFLQFAEENQRIEVNSFIDGNINEVSVEVIDYNTQEIVTKNYNKTRANKVKDCSVEKCLNEIDLVYYVNYFSNLYAQFHELEN